MASEKDGGRTQRDMGIWYFRFWMLAAALLAVCYFWTVDGIML